MSRALPTAVLGLLLALTAGCDSEIDQYVADAASHNPMMRLEAAKRAKQYDDPRMAAAAATLLSDDSAEIRYYAAVSLQTIGSANEVPVLIATLNDEDDDVRLAAVDALGILRDERAVDPLIMMLETEPQPYSVIWALGNTGGDKALDALAPLLESDDRYISYGASRALLKIR